MSSKETKEREMFHTLLDLNHNSPPSETANELSERLNNANNLITSSMVLSQGGMQQSQDNIPSQSCSVKAVFSQSQNIAKDSEQNGDKGKENYQPDKILEEEDKDDTEFIRKEIPSKYSPKHKKYIMETPDRSCIRSCTTQSKEPNSDVKT